MNPTLPHAPSPESAQDEEHELPCAEGLLAASLALMTGFSDPQACAAHRPLMARKVSENLAALCEHPLLNPHFKTVLWGLAQRWQARCTTGTPGAAGPDEPPARTSWMKAPATLQ